MEADMESLASSEGLTDGPEVRLGKRSVISAPTLTGKRFGLVLNLSPITEMSEGELAGGQLTGQSADMWPGSF